MHTDPIVKWCYRLTAMQSTMPRACHPRESGADAGRVRTAGLIASALGHRLTQRQKPHSSIARRRTAGIRLQVAETRHRGIPLDPQRSYGAAGTDGASSRALWVLVRVIGSCEPSSIRLHRQLWPARAAPPAAGDHPSLSPACDPRPPNAVNPARGFPSACAVVTSATGLSFGRHRGWSPSNRRSLCHGHYR